MNSNFNSKFITEGVIDSNFTFGVVVHSLYKLYSPFLNDKFSNCPPNNYSWYSIECLFKVNKSKAQFPVLRQMFFLQLSEDEYCISCAQSRHEAKLHVINEYFFPDDLFHHHSFNSFHDMIKGFKTSAGTSYQSITFPFVDVADKTILPVRGMVPFLTMSLARSATNRTLVSLEAFNISATVPEGPETLPFFILIIAFHTILIIMSMGGPTTGSTARFSEFKENSSFRRCS